MIYNGIKSNMSEQKLVSLFNSRDSEAFGIVYLNIYKELFRFTSKVVHDTNLEADDVIHDIFINIWESSMRDFKSINNIKAYIYVSVKNYLRNNLDHQKTINRFAKEILEDDDYFAIKVAEVEVYSILEVSMKLLPDECLKVFKLYIEGYTIKEIAEKLNKNINTVYTQKRDAFTFIKQKLLKDDFLFYLFIMS